MLNIVKTILILRLVYLSLYYFSLQQCYLIWVVTAVIVSVTGPQFRDAKIIFAFELVSGALFVHICKDDVTVKIGIEQQIKII